MSNENNLTKELEFFNSKLSEWIKIYSNQFVLVKGADFFGNFSTAEEAYEKGVKQFGTDIFLVKKVESKERKENIPALTLGVLVDNY